MSLAFAIPDHPWVDSTDGAAVRVALTVGVGGCGNGVVLKSVKETPAKDGVVDVVFGSARGVIHEDLSIGAHVVGAVQLQSNRPLSFQGVILVGEGFRLDADDLRKAGVSAEKLPQVVKRYSIGRDLSQIPEARWVIDFFGLTESESRTEHPSLFQVLLERVKPERDSSRDEGFRSDWWLFGRPRPEMRAALAQLPQYRRHLSNGEAPRLRLLGRECTSRRKDYRDCPRRRGFARYSFLKSPCALGSSKRARSSRTAPTTITVIASVRFLSLCALLTVADRIRQLGEQLDAHRKRQQAAHPGLTITGMYNVLEKLRSGEVLTAKEKGIHEQGLVSVLKQIHDELDAAVFEAYGWPVTLTDEEILERLVALNHERAEEEKRGIVRWLRPEFQNPQGKKDAVQDEIPGTGQKKAKKGAKARQRPAKAEKRAWPKELPQQVAAVRDLLAESRHARPRPQPRRPSRGPRTRRWPLPRQPGGVGPRRRLRRRPGAELVGGAVGSWGERKAQEWV